MAILRNVLSSTTNTNIGKIIRGSTRLDSDRGSYFTRTPSSAGNRRKWTLSVWIKNTNNYEEDVNQTSNYHINAAGTWTCLFYPSPSPRDRTRYSMPSSA